MLAIASERCNSIVIKCGERRENQFRNRNDPSERENTKLSLKKVFIALFHDFVVFIQFYFSSKGNNFKEIVYLVSLLFSSILLFLQSNKNCHYTSELLGI